MTARSTWEATNGTTATPGTAGSTRVASNQSNTLTAQESINAVGVNIGANPMLGVTAAHDATIRAANVTYQQAKQTATVVEQAALDVALATLRNTGDVGPR